MGDSAFSQVSLPVSRYTTYRWRIDQSQTPSQRACVSVYALSRLQGSGRSPGCASSPRSPVSRRLAHALCPHCSRLASRLQPTITNAVTYLDKLTKRARQRLRVVVCVLACLGRLSQNLLVLGLCLLRVISQLWWKASLQADQVAFRSAEFNDGIV